MGPIFNAGIEEPSEVKMALVDRSMSLFVRTLGDTSRPKDEFERHQQEPEVQRKRRMFRIVTCLMGRVLEIIRGQPYFMPNMAMAQKLWDELDAGEHGLVRAFGLPKMAPRKNNKRSDYLLTLMVLAGVAEVFVFRQTNWKYDNAKLTPDGELPAYDEKQLYDVVRTLHPTQELALFAWTMALEMNIGTSMMGLNAMTVVADSFDFRFSDLLREATDGKGTFNLDEWCPKVNVPGANPKPKLTSEFFNLFHNHSLTSSQPVDADLERVRKMGERLRVQREAGAAYRFVCSQSELQNNVVDDGFRLVDRALRDKPLVVGDRRTLLDQEAAQAVTSQGSQGSPASPATLVGSPRARGAAVWAAQGAPPTPGDAAAFLGYHQARAIEHPGEGNCALKHQDGRKMPAYHGDDRTCPYCFAPPTMPAACSAVAPDVVSASLFYKPSAMLRWAQDGYHEMGKGSGSDHGSNPFVGTRSQRRYVERGSADNGNKTYNFGWVQMPHAVDNDGNQKRKMESFQKLARDIRISKESQTLQQFDMHEEGLRDLCYLLCQKENARFCPEQPKMSRDPVDYHWSQSMEDHNKQDIQQGDRLATTCRPVPYPPLRGPSTGALVGPGQDEGREVARHPLSRVPDTELQRAMDGMLRRNRAFAASVLMSNRVFCAPPLRLYQDGFQANVGALHQHISLVAESILQCADVPGLRNEQEAFCGQATGPENTVRDEDDQIAGDAHYHHQSPQSTVRGTAQLPGPAPPPATLPSPPAPVVAPPEDAPAPQPKRARHVRVDAPASARERAAAVQEAKRKRAAEDEREALGGAAATPAAAAAAAAAVASGAVPPKTSVSKLPYSYDIVQIMIARRMARLFYDDEGEREAERVHAEYGAVLGIPKLQHDELPHLTMPFPGYSPRNRQTLSMRIARLPSVARVEAGDADATTSYVTSEYVTSSLGRQASEQDVEAFIRRRAGSRRMSGVTGDLFAQSTWRTHALASLAERGMIPDDPQSHYATAVRDASLCLMARMVEYASAHQNKNPYTDLELKPQQSNTYEACDKRAVSRDRDRDRPVRAARARVAFGVAAQPTAAPALPGFGAGRLGVQPGRTEGDLEVGDRMRA